MIKPVLTAALIAALTFSTGCVFSKKDRPKESSAISGDVEATFRLRWIEKRSAELTAQGVAAPAAKSKAEEEFRERYHFGEKAKH
jgi:hypothetical protein